MEVQARNNYKTERTASLTVEAAIAMPIFLFCILIFLYFLQIITIQEHIQEAITKTGLALARSAYVYEDFLDTEELGTFDFAIFGEAYELDLAEAAKVIAGEQVIKGLLKEELDIPQINNSCIRGGYRDISFYYSRLLEEDCIDIVVRYRIRFPMWFFSLEDLRMIQRVRLRGWTGHQIPAVYSIVKEGGADGETMVYITPTGTVYHRNSNCSHIKLSVREIGSIPEGLRNDSGGKYYSCEICCEEADFKGVYYITDYGDRYHIAMSCSGLKRTVREVPLSEVTDRVPCKRCGN